MTSLLTLILITLFFVGLMFLAYLTSFILDKLFVKLNLFCGISEATLFSVVFIIIVLITILFLRG